MDIESGGMNGYNYGAGGVNDYMAATSDEIDVEEESFTFHVDKEQLKLSLYKCDDLKRVPEIPTSGTPFERFFDNICEACENETRCVKVYTLGSTDWNDKGVGFISTYIDSEYKFMTLTVISSSLLAILITKVNPTTTYRREQDAMIVWNDPFTNEDLALSFNDPRGCEDIHKQIELFIARCSPASTSPSTITSAAAPPQTYDIFTSQSMPSTTSPISASTPTYFNALDTMPLDCYTGNSAEMNAFEGPGNSGFGYQDYLDRDSGLISGAGGSALGRSDSGGNSSSIGSGSGGSGDSVQMSVEGLGKSTLGLPMPTADNLGEVEKIIGDEMGSLMHRSALIDTIVEEDYIGKLVVTFARCEDNERYESLCKLFNIFKTLTLLNDTKVLELLFSPRYINSVIGAFKYDKEIEESERRDYREELEKSRFKEVVPFNNPKLVDKIKETYSLQFVKDIVLAKYIDDQTSVTLNSLIYTSQLDVLTMIEGDRNFQYRLFHAIEESRPGTQERLECVQLLKEILCLPKLCLRPEAQFFRDLKSQGLFDHLHLTISDPLLTTRLATVEVIEMTLRSDPSLLRAFITSQQPGLLLAELVDRLFWDEDVGLMMNMSDIVTSLLDISGFRDMRDQKSYLDFLYKNFLPLLYRGPDIMPPLSASRKCYVNEDSVVLNVFEIYGYIVTNHGPRASEFLISNNIIEKALRYTERRESHLVLAAVRFLRTVIAANDQRLTTHITSTNKFEPLVKLFRKNYSRYNLINSAVLEVFDYITKMKMYPLVAYAVKSFGSQLRDVKYTSTFEKLDECYREYLDQLNSTKPQKRRLSMTGALDTDDYNEAYFDGDDDDDDNNNNNNNGTAGTSPTMATTNTGGVHQNDFIMGNASTSTISGGSASIASMSGLFESTPDFAGIKRSRSANSIAIELGTPPVLNGTTPAYAPNIASQSISSQNIVSQNIVANNSGISPSINGINGSLLGGYTGTNTTNTSNISPMLQGIRPPAVAGQQLSLRNMAGQQSPGFLPVGVPQVSPRLGSNTPTFTHQIMSPGLSGLSLIGGMSPSLGATSYQMSPRPVMSPSLMQLSGGQLPPSIQGVLGSGALQNQNIHQSISVFGQQTPGSSLQPGNSLQSQQSPSLFGYDQFRMNNPLQQPPQKQPKY